MAKKMRKRASYQTCCMHGLKETEPNVSFLVNGVCYSGGKEKVKCGCVFLLNSCAVSVKGSKSTEEQSGASFSVLLSVDRSRSLR